MTPSSPSFAHRLRTALGHHDHTTAARAVRAVTDAAPADVRARGEEFADRLRRALPRH